VVLERGGGGHIREEAFSRYGNIKNIDIKSSYSFLTCEDTTTEAAI
jgi:hypothetical protein